MNHPALAGKNDAASAQIRYQERASCRVCGHKDLAPILSLGESYVSDFISDETPPEQLTKAPMELVLCHSASGGCNLLQLKHTVPP